ncbi:MAG: hypothetical protein ACE5GX_12410 [Thermoanaerobaculia bacterium]
MRVRILAGASALALLVLFALKTLDVVRPDWLEPRGLELFSASMLVTASGLLLIFFTHLRTFLQARGLRSLAPAASIAMSGAGIGMMVDLRGLLASLGLARMTPEAIAACSLGETVSAVALLSFFVLLHRKAGPFLRGTSLAIAGASILVGLTLTVFLLDVLGPGSPWLTGWSYLPAALLAPAAALAVTWLARFFALLALDPVPMVLGPVC